MKFMSPEEKIVLDKYEDGLSWRTSDCPLCQLFVTEVGILNAEEKDLRIISIHLGKNHSIFPAQSLLSLANWTILMQQ